MAARLLTDDVLERLTERFSKRTRKLIASASAHAKANGTAFGGMPLLVFGHIAEKGKPAGAYDLIDEISRALGRPVTPPSVYRSIEHLTVLRLVSRLSCRNAYVVCAHPGHAHDCVLLVCESCGETAELEDKRLDKLIGKRVKAAGFAPRHRILEVEGTCQACQAA